MNITVGISSGIAAFKVLELLSLLKKEHDLQVIMTAHAAEMISKKEIEQIIGKKVHCALFEKNFNYKDILKKRTVDHIEVAKTTDLFVIAPVTANLLGKIAHGIADDFLTTTLLATRAQVLLCPSMNTEMWFHPAVQQNLKKVQEYGYLVMSPDSGSLACGTEGIGRLPEPAGIFHEIKNLVQTKTSLKGKKIIVTAGGTNEPIDSARTIGNKSSGKMGIALAEECHRRGAEVLLVRAKTAVDSPLPFQKKEFETSASLEQILKESIRGYDSIFHAAAVSDFAPTPLQGKIDSTRSLKLELHPLKKIINAIKTWHPQIRLIAFKAVHGVTKETSETVQRKMKESHADAMIVNDISRPDIGFGCDANEVIIHLSDGTIVPLAKTSKKNIARSIINTLIDHEILH
jgi:phosphopantothenoylcysteine decarboxylase/phosphopantothenate--cysteine ligase